MRRPFPLLRLFAVIAMLPAVACLRAAPAATGPPRAGAIDPAAGKVAGCRVEPHTQCKDADLAGANFAQGALRNAEFHDADLSGADLREADLRYADLSSADLSSADLSGADLQWADLSSAKLDHANLFDADLTKATVDGASFVGTFTCGTTTPAGTKDDQDCPQDA